MKVNTHNHVYEVKIDKNNPIEEHIVSKDFLEECKNVAKKYPRK